MRKEFDVEGLKVVKTEKGAFVFLAGEGWESGAAELSIKETRQLIAFLQKCLESEG